jgi:hypothetical protein
MDHDVKVLATKLDGLTSTVIDFKTESRRRWDEDRLDRNESREVQDKRHEDNVAAIREVRDEWKKTNGKVSTLSRLMDDLAGKVKNLSPGITMTQVTQWVALIVGTVLVLQFLGWHK